MSTGSPLSLKEFTIRDSLHLKELLDCVLVFTHACTAAARLLFPLVQSIEFPVHPKKKKKLHAYYLKVELCGILYIVV